MLYLRLIFTAIFWLSIFIPVGRPDVRTVRVFHPHDGPRQEFAEMFRSAGMRVTEADPDQLRELEIASTSLLVIAPDAVFPPDARVALSEYRCAGGHLMVLSPRAFDYTAHPTQPVDLVDLSTTEHLAIRRPDRVNTREEIVMLPDGQTGLILHTSRIGSQVYEINIPLNPHRRRDRSLICFNAKGDYDLEIVRLKLRDDDGRDWVAFCKVGRQWRSYQVSMADFLPVPQVEPGGKSPKSSERESRGPNEQPDPARVKRLSLGIDPSVLWTEQAGSLGVGSIQLAIPDKYGDVTTSALLRWRTAAERAKAKYPDWLVDPFIGATGLERAVEIGTSSSASFLDAFELERARAALALSPRPAVIGKTTIDLQDVIPFYASRRVPLLVATDAQSGNKVTVAELYMSADEDRDRFPVVAAFSLPAVDYRDVPELRAVVTDTARYMIETPKILSVHPNTTAGTDQGAAGQVHLTCRIVAFNPRPDGVRATVEATISGGLKWAGTVELPPGEATDIVADLGVVPSTFPRRRFQWSVSLADGQQVWDVLSDRVDIERTLLRAAQLLVHNQQNHADGRLSHHFFADIYGARALFQMGQHFSQSDTQQRHGKLLADCSPEKMRASALRFCDMIVERQRTDGAIPIGYHEGKGWYYVADGGSIALGLVQIASWLKDTDATRAARYLDAARKYMEFRQSFRQDASTAARLKRIHGNDARGICAGNYGLGLIGVDLWNGDRWGEVRREARGPYWVLACSMPVAAALADQTSDEKWLDIARTDISHYLQADYTAKGYFHSEAACWMYLALGDDSLGRQIRKLLERDAVPAAISATEHDMVEIDGRAVLRWLSLEYCRRWFGDEPATRAAIVKALWETGSESSSYSIRRVAELLPGSGNAPAIGASRYAAFTAIVLSEMLNPNCTLRCRLIEKRGNGG